MIIPKKMLSQISQFIKQTIADFSEQDALILNNENYSVDKNNFQPIPAGQETKSITFIDGGQAEVISTGNFCLSLIRVVAVTFKGNRKTNQALNEFYLFTKAVYQGKELFYDSKIFSQYALLIDQQDLFISSNEQTIKIGQERAPINRVASMARRFAELVLAAASGSELAVLDGTLEKTFLNEEKYLARLPARASALAKTSSLFTTRGNSPSVILNKIGPSGIWFYPAGETAAFVKLHPAAKHIFRFEGNRAALPYLAQQSSDALFLGYPYGLIAADKLARVSHEERNSLITRLLLKSDNKIISEYLQNTNAHEILDNLG